MGKQDVLRGAQDISIVRSLGDDRFVYAAKPSLQTQRQLYDVSVSDPADQEIPAFQRYWQFDEQVGIRGSSTYLTLRFDAKALRPNGLWVPGLLEAKALEAQGKLENGVYRDYGIAVYNGKKWNTDIAEVLLPEAEALGLKTPLFVPFRALNPVRNGKMTYGIEPSFVEAPKGIISGEEAQEQINSLDYKANSGVHRLVRYGSGFWGAYWYGLDGSNDCGRVDWVCGEAVAADLEQAYSAVTEREFSEKIRKLEAEKTRLQNEMQMRQSQFAESLKR